MKVTFNMKENKNAFTRHLIFFLVMTISASTTSLSAGELQSQKPDAMWDYKTINGKTYQLSVFLPSTYSEGESFPTFVIFHGGSWNAGEAKWHYPDCAYWSSRGMIAVSVDYRLKSRDNVQVPLECVKDAKSAIRFLRQNAKKLKVNPDKIVSAGGSAGGQLAAATSMVTVPRANDTSDNLSFSSTPNATILFNPWFRCEKELSPTHLITPNLPPMIIFAGGKDTAIPVQSMIDFKKAMSDSGNETTLYIGNEGAHGLCNGRKPNNRIFYWSLDITDKFLVDHGIITGDSTVKHFAPKGLTPLTPEEFQTF